VERVSTLEEFYCPHLMTVVIAVAAEKKEAF
jgi:hypothetical protein